MSERKVDAMEENKTNSNKIELKERLVKKMKGVVTFLEGAPVHNEESISNLTKHYDNFMLALKYFPAKKSFTDLPMEIKTKILNYLCGDCGTLIAASVCQEWKLILKKVYQNKEKVIIGRHCKNWREDQCFNPGDMVKASLVLKLNIPLSVCCPVNEVDPKLLAKALISAPEFTLDNTCGSCVVEILDFKDLAILTKEQGEELMKALEMKTEPMDKVVLKGLDLTYLKDRMLSCLLKKVKTLTLTQDRYHSRQKKVLNFSSLTRKLRQTSTGRNLERLNLYFEYNGRLDAELLVDALCTVEKIDLGGNFYVDGVLAKRLIAKMSTGVTMKTLIIQSLRNWTSLISPTELGRALSNMDRVRLEGKFSLEQLEVVRSLPRGYAVLRSDYARFLPRGYAVQRQDYIYNSVYSLGIN